MKLRFIHLFVASILFSVPSFGYTNNWYITSYRTGGGDIMYVCIIEGENEYEGLDRSIVVQQCQEEALDW